MAVRNGATLNFLLNDHLGSTSVTLNKLGTETGELRYSAWGETRYTSGTTPTDRQYTGQINDGDTGLYYYNARYYDPALRRFIQADTIVPDPNDPQTLNRYAYTNNNPIKYTDPTGHYADMGEGGGTKQCKRCYTVSNPAALTPATLENNPRCQAIGMAACQAELAGTVEVTGGGAILAEGAVLGGGAASAIEAAGNAISNAAHAIGGAAVKLVQGLIGGATVVSADGDPSNEAVAANRAVHELQKIDYRRLMEKPWTTGWWSESYTKGLGVYLRTQ